MAKQTSLAAQVAKLDDEKKISAAKEDEAAAELPVPAGMARVRLIRPFYDSTGRLHSEGIVLLPKKDIPSSAKILAVGESAKE
jgi:hypothetical protein